MDGWIDRYMQGRKAKVGGIGRMVGDHALHATFRDGMLR